MKGLLMALWDRLIELSNEIEKLFDEHFDESNVDLSAFNFHGWKDRIWSTDSIRKCHLKTIDHREDKKLWLMHINIFPQRNILLPILGFDIVAGPGKITGAFFDYSSPFDHPYLDYLEMYSKSLEWNKPRETPDWGKNIFSTDMIAVGNIREGRELDQLLETSYDLTRNYVENLNMNSFEIDADMKDYHNMYCIQQKKNPHLHRSILALGVSEENKDRYINEILFEEI
jgi:hypothetical protein